jgi:hypothetical protein
MLCGQQQAVAVNVIANLVRNSIECGEHVVLF